MSLFDEVEVLMPLPGNVPEFIRKSPYFQTYDLGKNMCEYTISENGELFMEHSCMDFIFQGIMGEFKPTKIEYKRKKIVLYTSNIKGGKPVDGGYLLETCDGMPCLNIHYTVQIRDSRVSSIKETHRFERPLFQKR